MGAGLDVFVTFDRQRVNKNRVIYFTVVVGSWSLGHGVEGVGLIVFEEDKIRVSLQLSKVEKDRGDDEESLYNEVKEWT